MRCSWRIIGNGLLAAAIGWSGAVAGQVLPEPPDPVEQVHWAMGAFLGTGWYEVRDNRSVFVLRYAPRQEWSTAGEDEEGRMQPGLEFHYPVALGLHKLDDLPDFLDFDNFGTISFTPGFHYVVPLSKRWQIRPYIHFGYGYEQTSGESAWIYYGGVKSRYRLGDADGRWSFLSAAHFAGYNPDYADRGRYGQLMFGVEGRHGLPWSLGGDALFIESHLTYSWMFNRLDFHTTPEDFDKIRDQIEFGLALSKGSKDLRMLGMGFERLGLAMQWSSNGKFKAITVNLRSPFTR